MKFRGFAKTVEISPPSSVDLEFLESAVSLSKIFDAANVTDCPLGIVRASSLSVAALLKQKSGIEPIVQMTCRDRNRIAVTADLLGANLLGIKNVLALTGDYAAGAVFELDSVRLIKHIKEMEKEYKGFSMDVLCAVNPHMKNMKAELLKLEKKFSVGAELAQSQPVFDPDHLKEFSEQVPKEKVLVGILPLKSKEKAEFLDKKVPGIRLPKRVIGSIKSPKDGVKHAKELAEQARSLGFAGIHLLPFGMTEYAEEIVEDL